MAGGQRVVTSQVGSGQARRGERAREKQGQRLRTDGAGTRCRFVYQA